MTRPRAWHAALIWLTGIALLAFASPLWREADWWLFARHVRAAPPPLHADLTLLDLPWDPDVGVFRRRLLDVVEQLAVPGQAPRAVIFDVQFVRDGRLVEELIAGMDELRALQTRLFAVVDPMEDGKRDPPPDPRYLERHELAIYERALDGQGHTEFAQAQGVVHYQPRLELGDGQTVPALAVQVGVQLFARPADDERPIVLRVGPSKALDAIRLVYEPTTRRLSGSRPPAELLRGRVVVIGSLAHDRPVAGGLPGPEYLLWALSARGQLAGDGEARLAADPRLLLTLVLASGALAAGLARVLFTQFPRWQSRVWLIGGVAGLCPVLLLAIVAQALGAAQLLLPQVSLPTLSALLAGGVSAWFARRYLDWRWTAAEPPPIESAYDVFISYSRTDPQHVAWVREQLVKPLEAARKPDGEPFTVFLDSEDLHPGEAWLQRLYHAIDASRFFVPVYSADYFKKDYCQRELAHALRRQRANETFIVAVDVAGQKIPSPYDTYQALPAGTATTGPDAVARRLIDALTRALHADEAQRRAQAASAGS
jgi:hypothetical protein